MFLCRFDEEKLESKLLLEGESEPLIEGNVGVSLFDQVLYAYPPEVEESEELPRSLEEKLKVVDGVRGGHFLGDLKTQGGE